MAALKDENTSHFNIKQIATLKHTGNKFKQMIEAK